MRRGSSAFPWAVIVGFALLAIVIANALPAIGQTDPPSPDREPFQFSMMETLPLGDAGACQMVPIPSGMQITLEAFYAEALGEGSVRARLDARRREGNVSTLRGTVPLVMRTTVGGIKAGSTLLLMHSHPIGDEAGVTYSFTMCMTRAAPHQGSMTVGMMVSGYAEPLEEVPPA